MNRKIKLLTGMVLILFFFIGFAVAQNRDEGEKSYNYWQKVLNNRNKMLIAISSRMVEKLGINGIKRKYGNYYKSEGKYYAVVDKNRFKKMLSKQWEKPLKEVESDKRWRARLKKSKDEKERIGKALEKLHTDGEGGSSVGSSE
jgi:hypothetical protein